MDFAAGPLLYGLGTLCDAVSGRRALLFGYMFTVTGQDDRHLSTGRIAQRMASAYQESAATSSKAMA